MATAIDQQRLAAVIHAGETPGDVCGAALKPPSLSPIVDAQLRGSTHRALAVRNLALAESGTRTLAAMRFGKRMVVTYRLGALSCRAVKTLLPMQIVALTLFWRVADRSRILLLNR